MKYWNIEITANTVQKIQSPTKKYVYDVYKAECVNWCELLYYDDMCPF